MATAIVAEIPLALADELRVIAGKDGVLTNPAELRVYECDACTLEKSLPNVVVLQLGGSVTGEHGIGVEKIDFMEKQFTQDDLDAMGALRRVFDPEDRCNPHKMFPGSKRCGDSAPKKQIAA